MTVPAVDLVVPVTVPIAPVIPTPGGGGDDDCSYDGGTFFDLYFDTVDVDGGSFFDPFGPADIDGGTL